MIPKSHPYWLVRSIIENNPRVATLSMSYYSYSPQTVADARLKWDLSSSHFLDSQRMEVIIEETPDEHELAMHSIVKLDSGEQRHLVMVDMSTSAKAHLEKLRAYLDYEFFQRISWFTSGRSFHGYGEDILSEGDWIKFMGLLLLANKPRVEPTVDPRWIGHRLLAGYSALRWTRNTAHYLTLPSRMELHGLRRSATNEVGALGKPLHR